MLRYVQPDRSGASSVFVVQQASRAGSADGCFNRPGVRVDQQELQRGEGRISERVLENLPQPAEDSPAGAAEADEDRGAIFGRLSAEVHRGQAPRLAKGDGDRVPVVGLAHGHFSGWDGVTAGSRGLVERRPVHGPLRAAGYFGVPGEHARGGPAAEPGHQFAATVEPPAGVLG